MYILSIPLFQNGFPATIRLSGAISTLLFLSSRNLHHVKTHPLKTWMVSVTKQAQSDTLSLCWSWPHDMRMNWQTYRVCELPLVWQTLWPTYMQEETATRSEVTIYPFFVFSSSWNLFRYIQRMDDLSKHLFCGILWGWRVYLSISTICSVVYFEDG